MNNESIIAERIVKKILAVKSRGTFNPYRRGITLRWMPDHLEESSKDAARSKFREFASDFAAEAKKIFPGIRFKLKPANVEVGKARWGSWLELYISVGHDADDKHPYVSYWDDVYPLYEAMQKRGWKLK